MDQLSGQSHEIQTESFENMLNIPSCPKANQDQNKKSIKQQQEAAEQALKCPRCDSTNTKFCYYNNYSLSQPRYFCKSCRRYWTKGGTLRNVPVGGGCRKNKRSSPSSISSPSLSSSSSLKRSHNSNPNPIIYDHPSSSTDLTLAFAKLQNQTNGQMGLFDYYSHSNFQNMCYGFGNGSYENGGVPNFEEYSNNNNNASSTAPAMKQELCINNGDQNMAMWGFPWQFNNYNGDLDLAGGRESWNFNGGNNNGTFFHGLLNSPLM